MLTFVWTANVPRRGISSRIGTIAGATGAGTATGAGLDPRTLPLSRSAHAPFRSVPFRSQRGSMVSTPAVVAGTRRDNARIRGGSVSSGVVGLAEEWVADIEAELARSTGEL